MAYEQMNRPETYGDVFGDVGQNLSGKPIVKEDAAAMQSAENQVLGVTPAGGAASKMQSAADRSINRGVLSPDAGSQVDEPGMTVVARTTERGDIVETEYVEGVQVATGRVSVDRNDQPPDPRLHLDPFLATGGGDIPDTGSRGGAGIPGVADLLLPGETIGEALETAALQRADKEVTEADARAIQSAEARATGQQNVFGGPASVAQSAVGTGATLGDVLLDATDRLPTDRLVTQEDASAVQSAEQRNNMGVAEPGGVAASMQQAADLNRSLGLV